MYEISKTFKFSAAHQLDHLPEDHKCHRLHGHNYTVTFSLVADHLDSDGFVVDYAELTDTMGKWIKHNLDHRNLNDVMPMPSTAENLARWLYEDLDVYDWGHMVTAVMVQETESSSATFMP